jgi:hypothetical protein
VSVLSPEKLLVVLAVVMVVVGPDKMPKLASQIGVLWKDLQAWRTRLEHEARGIFPDLPPLETISKAVRSPLSYLDELNSDSATTSAIVAEPHDPFEAAALMSSGAKLPSVDVPVAHAPSDAFDACLN